MIFLGLYQLSSLFQPLIHLVFTFVSVFTLSLLFLFVLSYSVFTA